MKIKENPKAVAKGYQPDPFFFKEKRGGVGQNARIVAWSPHLRQLKEIFYSVLRTFPQSVEILLKLEERGRNGKSQWKKYYGKTSLSKLERTVKSNEQFFFQDGHIQVSIKRSDTGEYLTFDEHGVVYIYSSSDKFEKLCVKVGFEKRVEKLVSESGHWHVLPKDSEKFKRNFISQLNLKAVS